MRFSSLLRRPHTRINPSVIPCKSRAQVSAENSGTSEIVLDRPGAQVEPSRADNTLATIAESVHSIIQLIYASAATEPFSPQQLERLLEQSRKRNTLYSVTGMLLYHAGSFLQVLEGPESGVDTIYRSVSRDLRHHNVALILRSEIQQREFETWSMGFADTTNSMDRPDAFVDYFRELPALIDAPTQARKYLRFFQQGLCHQAVAS